MRQKKGMKIYGLFAGLLVALLFAGCRQGTAPKTEIMTTVPEKPETEETPEKPETADKSEMAETGEEADRQKPETTEMPEKPVKPESEETPETIETADKSETAEKPEMAETGEEADRQKQETTEVPEKPEKLEPEETPETIETADKSETEETPEKPDRLEPAETDEKEEQPSEPEKPELTEAERIELTAKRTTMRPTLSYIGQVINYYFLEDVDTEALVEQTLERVTLDTTVDEAIKLLVAGLEDPYSAYYTAQEYKNVMDGNTGNYCGIGATVQKDEETGGIRIVEPFAGGPAEKAGLQINDRILAVDGIDVTGMELDEAINYVKGEQGTAVKLTILRGEKKRTVTVYRDFVTTITVTSELKEDSIGYIKLSQFEEVSAEQFGRAVEELSDVGMKGLIIDLRNNPGGLLSSVAQILERILPEGKLITYTEDKYGNRENLYTSESDQIEVPMVVLVNGGSASASELFTGAVKDYGVATIVGENTFGKGIVQSYLQFTDGSSLKLTVSRYFTPNGICIHKTGILPDYVLANEAEGVDEQLEFALELLR